MLIMSQAQEEQEEQEEQEAPNSRRRWKLEQ
jgi:hypothetical protein